MIKKTSIMILVLTVLTVATGYAATTPIAAAKFSNGLTAAIAEAPPDSLFDVLVSLGDDGSTINRMATSALTLPARYKAVGRHLRATAGHSQDKLKRQLRFDHTGADIRVLKSYWVSNLMRVQTDRDGLLSLAENGDVVAITDNARVQLIEPVVLGSESDVTAAAKVGLQAVGATAAWAAGWTGKGRIVASIDTGVEGTHPALAGNWRGNQGDTSAAWFDPYDAPAPIDNNGHGTHVMGVMVGRTDTDTIGVAPDAEWINAAVIDRGNSLSNTIADILDALEWIIDPDGNPETTNDVPDVVCNSWGVSQQIINPCDPIFFEAIDNVEAMGIVCVFAAGNEGPNSMSIRNPADRATSSTSSFSVGAVDATIEGMPVPSFSSRGPSACDGVSIKPEVVAPGVAIYSAYKGGSYRTMNGTSMAAPFVAATVAILRQANPNVTPEEIKTLLLDAAIDVGAPGEDNESGHGLLDLVGALANIPSVERPEITLASYVVDKSGNTILAPGETSTLAVELAGATADAHDVYGTIEPLSAGLSIDVDSAFFGTLVAGETVSNSSSPFMIGILPGTHLGDTLSVEFKLAGDPLLGLWSDTINFVCGLPGGYDVATVSGFDGSLTLTNFGHLGVADASAMAAGGEGWFDNGIQENLLYEASLMVKSGDGRFADATRGSGLDFAPVEQVTLSTDPNGDNMGTTVFDDSRAANPLGVRIEQTVTKYANASVGRFAVVELDIENTSGGFLPGVQLGYLIDIDLPIGDWADETPYAFTNASGFYLGSGSGSLVAGVAALSAPFTSVQHYSEPADTKTELLLSEKISAFSAPTDTPGPGEGDASAIVTTAPVDLAAGQTMSFALVLMVADSPEQLASTLDDARQSWQQVTDVDEDQDDAAALPRVFLSQNYPNPFNPQTIISFSLSLGGHTRLEIFNVMGQHVRTLVNGWNPSGPTSVVWDGRDESGQDVASGIYLYRLRTDADTETRKMVLMR